MSQERKAPRKDGLCWWGDGSCPNEQTNRSWYCSEHEKPATATPAAAVPPAQI